MYQVPPFETTVTLFGRDGSSCLFYSLSAALKTLGLRWIHFNVARHFTVFSHISYIHSESGIVQQRVYRHANFIMRDALGNVVTYIECAPNRVRYISPRNKQYAQWNGTGPAPGTRKPKASQRVRRVTTPLNLLRSSETFVEEGEVAPRPKRNVKIDPQDCDDYYHKQPCIKNWKHYRKHQWKVSS